MKISFSTLGCPEWSWEDIVATAKDFGYEGIEVRGIEKELYMPKAKPFQPNEIEKTKKHLADLGLTIPCLTSACYLHIPEKRELYINEAKEYIELCVTLNTPYIRVLGDTDPQPGDNIEVNAVIEALQEIGSYAEQKGIEVLLESNGIFADSNLLKEVMQAVGRKSVGVLWDVHHPYRYMNEPIAKTYEALKPYIKHIHIKDSVVQDGKITYRMIGQGDIPINDCLALLKRDAFEGFVSLEWVKRWYGDLEEPGIVFMQFENYIRNMWAKI